MQVTPLDKAEDGEWIVMADGERIYPRLLTFEHPKFGKMSLGRWPQGFQSWSYKSADQGTVTIPWSKTPDGELLLALIYADRPCAGGLIWDRIGGAVEAGESLAAAQAREAGEEAGVDASKAKPIIGGPINPDTARYEYTRGTDTGLYIYELEIPFSSLEEESPGVWKPREGTLKSKSESQIRFFHWRNAILRTYDGVALAAFARFIICFPIIAA